MFPDSFHISKPIRLCQLLHLQNIIASGSSGLQKWNWCRLLFSPNQHQPLFLGILRNQYVPSKFLIHSNLLSIPLKYIIYIYCSIEIISFFKFFIINWRIIFNLIQWNKQFRIFSLILSALVMYIYIDVLRVYQLSLILDNEGTQLRMCLTCITYKGTIV